MNRLLALGGLLGFVCVACPVAAGELGSPDAPCYWCIRDAIYADVTLINRLEANPDVDESVKGPEIIAARAEIHRLRRILGPLDQGGTEPCCYSRRPIYIR
ncbi:MAG: hypothetical protein WA652_05335 [Xanthobacteraceae bacterium]